MNQIYVQDLEYRMRNIGKKNYLFGNAGAFEINETGLLIWDSFNGRNTNAEILEKLVSIYAGTPETALKNDFLDFLMFLKEINAIAPE